MVGLGREVGEEEGGRGWSGEGEGEWGLPNLPLVSKLLGTPLERPCLLF